MSHIITYIIQIGKIFLSNKITEYKIFKHKQNILQNFFFITRYINNDKIRVIEKYKPMRDCFENKEEIYIKEKILWDDISENKIYFQW